MESVYIETSVVSYLVARPSRDPVTGWRQRLTKEWWAEQRGQFACIISQEVIVEAMAGDVGMAAKRMAALQGIPLISVEPESAKLAADLLERGLFPAVRPRRCESSGGGHLCCGRLFADVEFPAPGECTGFAAAGKIYRGARPAFAACLHAGRTHGKLRL